MSSDEDCYIISSQPSNSATSSDKNKSISSSLPKFTCPMCSKICEELIEIEAHIENEHLVKSSFKHVSILYNLRIILTLGK